MPTVLSTKKLKPNQRSLLLHAGLSLVEYDAIHIEFIPFKAPQHIRNAIFTSQNGVLSIQKLGMKIQNCFCVGKKTKALLEENGYTVVRMEEYATELAEYLVQNHREDSFHFFCGNIRSEEIPSKLKENNISFEEIVVYKTTLNPKQFEKTFDAVLFFSPSGVRSYMKENTMEPKSIAICIGTTTASEARKYSRNVVISNSTLIESVISKTVKTLKN